MGISIEERIISKKASKETNPINQYIKRSKKGEPSLKEEITVNYEELPPDLLFAPPVSYSVVVIITLPIINSSLYDPERVLLCLPNMEEEVGITYTTRDSFTADVRSLSLEPETVSQLLPSLEAFFSNSPQESKEDVLFSVIKSDTDLNVLWETALSNDRNQFGHIAIIGQTVTSPIVTGAIFRNEVSNYSSISSFGNSLPFRAEIWSYDRALLLDITDDNAVSIVHSQPDLAVLNQESSGYLLEKSLSYIAQQMSSSTNPNAPSYTTIPSAVGLIANNFSLSVSNQLKDANVNQYRSQNGLTRFTLGTTRSGQSIERFSMAYRHIPYFLTNQLETWQENTKPKLSDQDLFEDKLRSLLKTLESQRIIGKDFSTDNPILGGKSFIIDSVTSGVDSKGRAQFDASFRALYDNNVIAIIIRGTIVEILVGVA